jgi:putative ABC transport system permease protein
MRARSYVKTSLIQMRANLIRTLLTLLGVVFGVASVIAMLTIGEGAQRQILRNIEAMGATLVHVLPTEVSASQISRIVESSRGVSLGDVQAIRESLPQEGRRVSYFEKATLKVTSLPVQSTQLRVFAVDEAFVETVGLKVIRGSGMTAHLTSTCSPVALITDLCARRFFGGIDSVLGQRVRLDYRWFEVIGVVSSVRGAGRDTPGTASTAATPTRTGTGRDVDLPVAVYEYEDALFIPLTTYHSALLPPPRYGELDRIVVGCRSLQETNHVKEHVGRILSITHGGVSDYRIVSPQELLDQQRATQSIFNVVLLSIAAISLLVGGIGIMNIMLANVMERRAEIGIRRALGAKKRHIVIQFLAESTFISLVGGVLGVLLGVGISFGILEFTRIPIALSASPIVLSFGISITVGIVFGLVPARRAADVNPIEALHNE